MKKHASLSFGLLAVLLAVVMIATTLINAGAATNGIPDTEIDAIVNTTTDASQVTSPFIQVANDVRNSVVGVNNYTTTQSYYGYGFGYGYGGRNSEPRESLAGTGSGVVISNYGHVLTNYHVVEGSSRVTVTTALDESEHEATVVGYDSDLDIAVLQVPGLDLKAVPLGDSDQLQVGEWAIVIGNPLGEDFARTLTVGVVSAIDREVKDSTTDRYGRRTTISNTMIQVDAAINSGNSGGGLFNTLGQLQGIPARKYSSNGFFSASIDNIGMCIPINVAKPLIQQVLKDYDAFAATASAGRSGSGNDAAVNSPLQGKPRLGITVTTINTGAASVIPQGAFVKVVDENSPAAEGGIQPGDIIVEVDGTVISSHTALTQKLAGYNEGDQLAIKVFRDEGLAQFADQNGIDLSQVGEGQYIDLTVTLRVIDDLNM
ncbi:MAG: trypsin-like peptidase domain-containing protein [Clostridia bacterium]|nr:trypsin-like peptidase domain-containing protein [Clostridia bacterium]